MSEMIDRLAKAVRDTAFEGGGSREIARAAIEVMREPTEAMCMEAEHANRMGGIWTAKTAWQAMIDQALSK